MSKNDIINWGQLSRLLSGSRQTVRKNKVPIKHQPIVNELINAIDAVLLQTVRKNKIPKIHQHFVDDLIKAMNKVIKKRTDNEAGL